MARLTQAKRERLLTQLSADLATITTGLLDAQRNLDEWSAGPRSQSYEQRGATTTPDGVHNAASHSDRFRTASTALDKGFAGLCRDTGHLADLIKQATTVSAVTWCPVSALAGVKEPATRTASNGQRVARWVHDWTTRNGTTPTKAQVQAHYSR